MQQFRPATRACRSCKAPLTDADPVVCPACMLAIAADSSEFPTITSTGSSRAADGIARLSPGQLFGPYRIERLLGSGGMGEVYEAEQIEHGRRVALKVVRGHLTDQADRARFSREGQLAASVHHPNSVYVFGAEEIDGLPVIAMELLPGGTLKERIAHAGPMEAAQAVDAILQVIAGLDAAHQAGVLHRDVKPSNCFLALDGTVKIGDFGLSISALSRRSDMLTEPDEIRATPQFAAPEQLKGEPLDLRADIYAVGATLHYLLTGHAPFDGDTLGSLLARVLSEPAPSARAVRSAIPAGLDRVLMRCLAKDPAGRPADYAALHHALRPFSTQAQSAAPRAWRVAAGAIDHLVLFPAAGAVAVGAYQSSLYSQVLAFVVFVAYFSMLEGIWGASVGKWMCGLRLATAAGTGAVGLDRALPRAVIYSLVWHAPAVVLFLLDRSGRTGSAVAIGRLIILALPYVLLALLFSPAHRRHRFASVCDRLTSTAVVAGDEGAVSSIVDSDERVHPAAGPGNLGPYRVLGELGPARPGRLLLAFDEAVKRRVWIHGVTDAPAVSPSRRHLARPGRLRWLTGHRAGSDGWDAYEAPDGAALRNVAATPQRWRIVKHWLSELAREIDHGVADGTLPSLSLDRVWITGRGQPVLLDFSLGPATPGLPADGERRQQFLRQAAGAALMGWRDSGSVAIERPLPLPARRTLTTLECAGFESFHDVRAALEDLCHRPDGISRRLRAASLLLPGAPVLWLISVILYVLRRFDALAVVAAPDAGRLFAGAFAIVAVLAGVTAFASRGGVVLRWWGIAVATTSGMPASHTRAVWRTFVAWSPLLAAPALVFGAGLQPRTALMTVMVAGLLMAGGLVYAVLNPERGLQDRIAGTWLVPR